MGNQSEADDSSPSLTTIFVVEDDADLGLLLLRFLEEEVPCRVVLATDGLEVLKLCDRSRRSCFWSITTSPV